MARGTIKIISLHFMKLNPITVSNNEYRQRREENFSYAQFNLLDSHVIISIWVIITTLLIIFICESMERTDITLWNGDSAGD